MGTLGTKVRWDNPRALVRELSYVQVDTHGITIVYHLHISRDISCESWKVLLCYIDPNTNYINKNPLLSINWLINYPEMTTKVFTGT